MKRVWHQKHVPCIEIRVDSTSELLSLNGLSLTLQPILTASCSLCSEIEK